ncbi:poly-beta-hydroxybutyrate polymerase [Sphingobium indicum IP26]|uniref:Poly-beta-hydroxybutyrate polymerase n=1 Tax=Sphingobium indicum F2 TaxID=1450518 RepID=A0A8E1C3P7_9SPHN|nr:MULTISPECIES: alpha/beta hydrolase [Sphingobium]EPR09739.1 poly-beta-hydroxybutyrate polymerase [Sphingobium indicum IP26]EQB04928.1 poly-beta-hydroxybutyrate polymerase [Sphingobium sp. HDIP04]KER37311.1 poly-beta-hydroxybutyrate polymerase [Sphingobium indicum F2]
MDTSPTPAFSALAQGNAAPQHGPRPLPLFLNILWRETQDDPELRKRAFQGLRKYQEASRPSPPPAVPVVASAGSARLLRYGTENGRFPVVFVPSLINPPQVLDLSASRSMLRHMSAAGHDAHLVDWGTPAADDGALGLDRHVTERLLPMLAALDRPAIVVGYCLGGNLAIGAAVLHPVRALATIATPWDFDGFPAADREEIGALWRSSKPMCQRLGYVPMEVLQSGFWAMDPARTIRKYAAFADMAPGSDEEHAFLAVEDWANGGPPLSHAAGRDLFEQFYAANASGRGEWLVGGRAIESRRLACPTLSIRSAADRIVPAAAAPEMAENATLNLGHVGMIVGGRARTMLWEPLSQWLSSHGG